jgi:hypothetical protein
MALWIVLSIMLGIGSALGAGGNFGDTPSLNRSVAAAAQSSKGLNPVQHSERSGTTTTQNSKGINPVQHSE